MNSDTHTGHDGPYDAPFETGERAVPADWLDYNGHMNVAYYTMAFDQAVDDWLENEVGIGESYVSQAQQGPYALQMNLNYIDEMLAGNVFTIPIQLVDHDMKRLHLFAEMRRQPDNTLTATCEVMLMNVDLNSRRSAPYPEWALTRLGHIRCAHIDLCHPDPGTQTLGIRRKGSR